MDILKPPRRHRTLRTILGLSIVTLVACGDSDEGNNDSRPQTKTEESTLVEFHEVGSLDVEYGGDTQLGYYEYVDEQGRVHVCDIATRTQSRAEGVGLSCEIITPQNVASGDQDRT